MSAAGRRSPHIASLMRAKRFDLGEAMPTVLRWGAYLAFFYSNEGREPAHIHVRSGAKEAKFWLHDLSVAVNAGFPAHEIGDIIRYLRSHSDKLLAAWHEHFGN